jgi:hypothetical protein
LDLFQQQPGIDDQSGTVNRQQSLKFERKLPRPSTKGFDAAFMGQSVPKIVPELLCEFATFTEFGKMLLYSSRGGDVTGYISNEFDSCAGN